jgi:RNA polymerase sigma-70 factor (ECF subfamily)
MANKYHPRRIGLDERQLIKRVLTGDAKAERVLYEAHVERIYRLAYRMTGDESLAEDYTQETFVRAFTRLADFRGQAALATWLHTIAVSVVINGLRKIKRLRQRETDLEAVPSGLMAKRTADPQLNLLLHQAIDALTDSLRLVFVMHDIEGYKHQEIADILAVPVGTSKSRLAVARQRLRAFLTRAGSPPALEEGL